MIVDSSNISVIVQGAIAKENNLTHRCLLSIRKYLPNAEIILSTWEGSDVKGLSYDKCVFSKDPGGVLVGEQKGKKFFINTNRQIASTKAGLCEVTRNYAIKFRTDMFFTSNRFLQYFKRYPKKSDRLNLLSARVIVSSIFTPNPNRLSHKPFCVSDWFTFGLTEDVQKIWDIPLAPEPDNTLWFRTHPYPDGVSERDSMRYRTEQYIWLSFLRKYVEVPCEHQWDYGEHNRELHELSFANNLIVLHPREIGIKFVKYGIGLGGWANFYTHSEWQELYKKYCDSTFVVEIDFETKAKHKFARLLERNQLLRKVVSFFDYRYRRVTEAWNRENRWYHLWMLFVNLFRKS